MQLVAVVVAAEEQTVGVADEELLRVIRIALEWRAAPTGGQVGEEVGILVEQTVQAPAGVTGPSG